MRNIATITQSLIAKLLVGWGYGQRGGNLDTVLEGAATAIGDAEAAAEDMAAQIDPRNARELLTDFERVLGPDPCGRDLNELTLSERQQLAHQRWTALGGQSIPYLIDTAAKVGEPVEIIEYWPTKAGGMRCGDALIADGEQFLFKVRLSTDTAVSLFRAGKSCAGDRLGIFKISAAECELRRIKPAHTDIVFEYTQYLDLDGEPLMLDEDALVMGA